MANFALLACGQQAATAAAAALPSVIPPSPLPGAVRGEGVQVILENLKASTASLFYGPAGVTPATGKELAPGAQDVITVNDLSQIFIVAAVISTATASWSVTAK